jgi:adenylate cyclase
VGRIRSLLSRLTGSILAATLVVLLCVIRLVDPSPIEVLRLKSFDFLIRSLPHKTSEEIVIVDFGEKSADKFGQWPFDRRDIAHVISELRRNEAGVIVMPVLFSEKDRAGGDGELIKTITENGVIIAQTPTSQTKKPDAARRGFAAIGPIDPSSYAFSWPGAIRPLESLSDVSAGVGVAATTPEIDGVVRRMPLLVRIAGNTYPALPLEAIRVIGEDISYQVKTNEYGIESVRVPKFPAVDTDSRGRIWLSWNSSFNRLDATEIDERVKGKIVVLGLAMEGVGVIVPTPVGEKWAHDVQAAALQTMIDGSSISRQYYSDSIELLVLLALGLVLVLLVPKTSVRLTIPLYVLVVGGLVTASYYSFIELSQLWDVSYIVVASSLVFGYLVYNNFAREFRLKQQIKKQFEHYLAPAMVAKLQKNPELLRLGGDTRELTILFSDLRGFTTISEHYKSNPQGLTNLINKYLTPMTRLVYEKKGTLDKYIGDAIMAFWNAPLDDPDHRKNAIVTSMEMFEELRKLNEAIAGEGLAELQIGIGVNTGKVVVGNMGGDQRFDYTCLGDAVNLASRLEGQSKTYGVGVVVGEETVKTLDQIVFAELDIIAVKGKSEGIRIYTPIGIAEELEHTMNWVFAEQQHNKFLQLYRAGKWQAAKKFASDLKGEWNGVLTKYYEIMLERMEDLEKEISGPWDGIYVAKTK